MDKPLEVKFRDLEAKRLDEAFENWKEWPDTDMEQALREAVANYVHAQALVAYRAQKAIEDALARTWAGETGTLKLTEKR